MFDGDLKGFSPLLELTRKLKAKKSALISARFFQQT